MTQQSSFAPLHVGCCGFPAARKKYFANFSTVEVQQTFYQLPRLATAAKWRREAPEGFEFALKAWQLITHEPTSPTYRRLKIKVPQAKAGRYGSFKPTDEVVAAWEQTRRFAHELGAALVLFQCPASFAPTGRNMENMRRFFKSMNREGVELIWEPRGEWGRAEIRKLCEDLDLIHCLDPMQGAPLWGRLRYYRLHGPRGYSSRYDTEQLQRILEKCDAESYCFFNNRYMLEDACALLRLSGRK